MKKKNAKILIGEKTKKQKQTKKTYQTKKKKKTKQKKKHKPKKFDKHFIRKRLVLKSIFLYLLLILQCSGHTPRKWDDEYNFSATIFF